MIILVGFVVALITGNPLFALFAALWWIFTLVEKNTNHQVDDTNLFVKGVREL